MQIVQIYYIIIKIVIIEPSHLFIINIRFPANSISCTCLCSVEFNQKSIATQSERELKEVEMK